MMDQKEYEESTIRDLVSALSEVSNKSDIMESAARRHEIAPVQVKEFLKDIATVLQKCEAILGEHSRGDHFSDGSIAKVAQALVAARDGINDLVLQAALVGAKPQSSN
jgi:hypothetical protein